MSAISDSCRLALLIGDFANQDGGKVGLLGGGWSITPTPTPPQAVVVIIEVPGEHLNETFAVELTLFDEQGPLALPDPLTGETRPLRIAQNMLAPTIPGIPRKAWNKVHFVINLSPGLPLRPDHVYTWAASVDGDTRSDWKTSFYVVDQPAPPVVG